MTVTERDTREKKEITKRAAEKLSTPTEILSDPKNLKSWTKDLSDITNYLVIMLKYSLFFKFVKPSITIYHIPSIIIYLRLVYIL